MKRMFSVILLVITLCSIFCMAGCTTKTAVTADEFVTLIEPTSYFISDNTEYYSDKEEILHAYVVLLGNGDHQIDFYVTDTAQSAKQMYSEHKTLLEKYKGKDYTQTGSSGINYDTYKINTGGYYRVISRIDNTLLYANVKEIYKDEIDAILEDLGY